MMNLLANMDLRNSAKAGGEEVMHFIPPAKAGGNS